MQGISKARWLLIGLSILWVLLAGGPGGSTLHAEVLPAEASELPPYTFVNKVSGKFKVSGSDTMRKMLEQWQRQFRTIYPGVAITLETKGSSTAMPAFLKGDLLVAAMSRKMTDKETEAFVTTFGYEPTEIPVASDALAIYVHRDNPIQGLTLAELDAIWSKSRRRGQPVNVERWGQLGLTGEWANAPVRLHGRKPVSGTAAFLQKRVLLGGDYKEKVRKQPGTASTVLQVMQDRYAMGYGGIGYETNDVRAIPLAEEENKPFIEPTVATALNGTYPLSRRLYLYVNRSPDKPMPSAVVEFLKFVNSRDGQTAIVRTGFYPMQPHRISENLALVQADNKP